MNMNIIHNRFGALDWDLFLTLLYSNRFGINRGSLKYLFF